MVRKANGSRAKAMIERHETCMFSSRWYFVYDADRYALPAAPSMRTGAARCSRAAMGGMRVEECPIGVEDEGAGHREPPVSESWLGQKGWDRPSADVVDARVDGAVAYDLGQQRGIEFGAVKLPQHHREVGARRIPGGFEIGAEFDLR